MEIDHVFASGAVVERATMHSLGRLAPRCARSDGRPHLCVVARPTTAPDAKTWSILQHTLPRVLGVAEDIYNISWMYLYNTTISIFAMFNAYFSGLVK